tara:strand:+ start:587 stop:796 length:210 start_codon:yes stop_codon:yes gene_type:complete
MIKFHIKVYHPENNIILINKEFDTLKEISDELNIPYQFVADCSSRGFNKKFQNYSFVPKIEITKIKYTS